MHRTRRDRDPQSMALDTSAALVLIKPHRCYKNRMQRRPIHVVLTKRERQIMDALYRLGRATAGEIQASLPGAPSYSTVRTQLRVLEAKGHVRHEEHGLRYVYAPIVPRHSARRSALKHLVDTFFEGSSAKVVAALLGGDTAKITDDELDRIAEIVKRATVSRNDPAD
jgi:BlaI family transcriptional regulator, penicillinase repressor